MWEKEIVRQIASEYKVSEEYVDAKDERVDSFIERMVGLFGMGGFESAYEIPPPLWLTDAQLAEWKKSAEPVVAAWADSVKKAGNDPDAVMKDFKAVLAKYKSAY